MELIVEKIFERAQKHPEIIPDLKKLMNYYLPMTVKLLDAYEEMDQQPVQGENIQAELEESIPMKRMKIKERMQENYSLPGCK